MIWKWHVSFTSLPWIQVAAPLHGIVAALGLSREFFYTRPILESYRYAYERFMSVRVFHGMIMWCITYSQKVTEITKLIKHIWKCGPVYFQSCYWQNKDLYLRTVGICKCQCRTLPGDGWELWFWRSLLLTFNLICASWKRKALGTEMMNTLVPVSLPLLPLLSCTAEKHFPIVQWALQWAHFYLLQTVLERS